MTRPPADPVETPFGEPAAPVFGAAGPSDAPAGPPEWRDRLVLVTGATGLLGAAVAEELHRRGAMVCLMGRDPDALSRAADRLGPGARCAVLQGDLAVAEDVVAAVEFVARLDRPVDVVVHAAGLQSAAHVVEAPVEGLDEHYLLNVRGPYLLSQQLLPLVRDGAGRFVFFSAAEDGSRSGDAHHAITQAAARALADELRVETARRGLRVLTVVADEEPAFDRGTVDAASFVDAVAVGLADALSSDDLDVTELSVRGVARPVRAERR